MKYSVKAQLTLIFLYPFIFICTPSAITLIAQNTHWSVFLSIVLHMAAERIFQGQEVFSHLTIALHLMALKVNGCSQFRNATAAISWEKLGGACLMELQKLLPECLPNHVLMKWGLLAGLVCKLVISKITVIKLEIWDPNPHV